MTFIEIRLFENNVFKQKKKKNTKKLVETKITFHPDDIFLV